MKPLLRCTLSLACLLTAATAAAAPNPSGLNLAWTDCWGDGGTSNRTFACDTNLGFESINLSFKVDQPIANVCGMEMYLQLASQSAALPAWWSMLNAGTCRPTALAFVIQPEATWTQCVDWGAGTGNGGSGIGFYNIGAGGPNVVTTAAVVAVPTGSGLSLEPGVEYFTGRFRIAHAKTVGTDACGGCDVPVCLFYSRMRLFVDPGSTLAVTLTSPANTPNSQAVTWQGGQFTNLLHNCNSAGSCVTSFGCTTAPTSARANTWGAVKALYR